VIGDLFGERGGIGAVVEPAFVDDGDTGRGRRGRSFGLALRLRVA